MTFQAFIYSSIKFKKFGFEAFFKCRDMEAEVTSLICSLESVNKKKHKHLQVKNKRQTLFR